MGLQINCLDEPFSPALDAHGARYITATQANFRSSSNVRTELVDPRSDEAWDRLVLSHPHSTIFQTRAWANVLCQTYGHKPLYLRISEQGDPVALIPLMEVASPITGRRGVCLPFTDFCDPLLFGGDRSPLVLEAFSKLAHLRKWKYFELRGGRICQTSAKPAVTFYGHELDLRPGIEELFARFMSSARGAIRKAERSNLTIQIAQNIEAMMQFYRLHGQSRRRHGLPPQPVSFFRNIHHEIIKSGHGFVVLAKNETRAIAAAVFFRLGKKATYKFGASDERFHSLRANNLVMWEAIKSLAQNGVELLHFGRTSMENPGLRKFKLAWGTTEEMIEFFRFDIAAHEWVTARSRLFGFHNEIFRRLPLALNRMAGALIYPHLD